MKRCMRRFLSVILAAVMITSIAPVSGFVASAETEGYYTYSVTDNKATITGFDSSISGDLVIPGALGGYPVVSIGDSAFYFCRSLTSVTIPDSVTSIGVEAFSCCYSLTSVTIPDSVTSIGDYAFQFCDSLTSFTVDEANENYSSDSFGVLFNKDKTTLIKYPEGNSAASYTIPDSVTSIGDCAFGQSRNLASITIPDSVTSIGAGAFADCYGLTSITIPDGVTSIGGSAFYYCFNLTSITIPDSVTSIGEDAFHFCLSLKSVTIPATVEEIGEGALGYTYIEVISGLDEFLDVFQRYIIMDSSPNPDEEALAALLAELNSHIIVHEVPVVMDGFTIVGFVDSAAQVYAIENNIPFTVFVSEIPVTGVSLAPEAMSLEIGETAQLTATVAPADATNTAVTYSSSNNAIATVDEAGLVTAIAYGTATITVATEDGGFTDACEVTVLCTHVPSDWIIGTAATCTSAGSRYKKCTVCNTAIVTEAIAKLAHTPSGWIVDTAATCEAAGSRYKECTSCHIKTETQSVPALGHSDGNSDGKCDRCGADLGGQQACGCMCHKTGFMGFIYKLVRIFWKLFKTNPTCACGAAHY